MPSEAAKEATRRVWRALGFSVVEMMLRKSGALLGRWRV